MGPLARLASCADNPFVCKLCLFINTVPRTSATYNCLFCIERSHPSISLYRLVFVCKLVAAARSVLKIAELQAHNVSHLQHDVSLKISYYQNAERSYYDKTNLATFHNAKGCRKSSLPKINVRHKKRFYF